MKSSSPRISCQNSSTGVTLVKKRCPPTSKRHPSRSTVREIPPTTSSASSTTGRRPARTNSYAAVSPAGPAPMTTTSSARSPTKPAKSGSSGFSVDTASLNDKLSSKGDTPTRHDEGRQRLAVRRKDIVALEHRLAPVREALDA